MGSFLMSPLRDPDWPPRQPAHSAAIASSLTLPWQIRCGWGPRRKTQRTVMMAKTSCRHVKAPAILHGYFRIHTKEQVSIHLDRNSLVSSSIHKKLCPALDTRQSPGERYSLFFRGTWPLVFSCLLPLASACAKFQSTGLRSCWVFLCVQ